MGIQRQLRLERALYDELHSVLQRYIHENHITDVQIMGILENVKQDVRDEVKKQKESDDGVQQSEA